MSGLRGMDGMDGWARLYTIGADRLPLPCFDVLAWGLWHSTAEAACRVGDDGSDDCRVSTVFLGIDCNYGGGHDPVLFETMLFCADGECAVHERYRSWAEAHAGHERVVAMLAREQRDAAALTAATLRAMLATVP